MWRKIVYALAALHLSIVFLTIAHGIDERAYRWLETPLACLTAINYSAWRFAFFTPNVGKSTAVEIILENEASGLRRYHTGEGFRFFVANRESENRFYGFKVHAAKDSTYQDMSSRSICTRMLNLHRGMSRIHYSATGIQYPTMREFARDSAVSAEVYYETSFELY
jgi:hypothetical protein